MQTAQAQLVAAFLMACLISSGWTRTLAAGDEAKILKGHTAGVIAVSLSRDGHTVASASADNTVKLWDVGTGALLTTLSKEFSVLSVVALSSNGANLATGSREGPITIWDSAPGEEPTTLSGHRGVVRCLAYSADDLWLASGSADRTIRIWSAKTREFKTTLEGHTRGVFCLAFSPDGKTLASGSSDETAKIWNVERGTEETPAPIRRRAKRGAIVSLAFSLDGKHLAIATPEVVEVWNSVQSRPPYELARPEKGATWWSVSYSPQGKLIAIGSGARYARALRIDAKKGLSTGSHQPQDDEIRLWDAQSEHEIGELIGHHDSVRAVALSVDGTFLVSGGRDKTVRLWDPTRIRRPRATAPVAQIAVSSDGSKSSSNSDGAGRADDVNRLGSTVDAETARRESLTSLQHLTESSPVFEPVPGLQPWGSRTGRSGMGRDLGLGRRRRIVFLLGRPHRVDSDQGPPTGRQRRLKTQRSENSFTRRRVPLDAGHGRRARRRRLEPTRELSRTDSFSGLFKAIRLRESQRGVPLRRRTRRLVRRRGPRRRRSSEKGPMRPSATGIEPVKRAG